MSTTEKRKQEFLNTTNASDATVALDNSWRAAVSRNPTYKKGVIGQPRLQLAAAVKQELEVLGKSYRYPVSEAQHCKNIQILANRITNQFDGILRGDQFRIGAAQKALNLYVKFLWSLGLAEEPPHCPLDNVILGKAGIREAWTKLDSITEYSNWIQRLRKHTAPSSLAEWELENWP